MIVCCKVTADVCLQTWCLSSVNMILVVIIKSQLMFINIGLSCEAVYNHCRLLLLLLIFSSRGQQSLNTDRKSDEFVVVQLWTAASDTANLFSFNIFMFQLVQLLDILSFLCILCICVKQRGLQRINKLQFIIYEIL